MKDDRLRQPVRSDYAESLGRAIYCFTLCEWNVLWCSNRIQPGSLRRFLNAKLTSGKISIRFLSLVRGLPESDDRERLELLAKQFIGLVDRRNEIVHGSPCSGLNLEARLKGKKVLEISDIDDAADAFSECARGLNREFYGFLNRTDQYGAAE